MSKNSYGEESQRKLLSLHNEEKQHYYDMLDYLETKIIPNTIKDIPNEQPADTASEQ